MPNHCSNTLTIRGSATTIKSLIESVQDESGFNFNKIVPMPESLNIESGTNTDYALAILEHLDGNSKNLSKLLEYPWVKQLNILDLNSLATYLIDNNRADMIAGAKALINQNKYGHKDWYSWRIEHWGTKWNAYEPDLKWTDGEDAAVVRFTTAWSPPVPVIQVLSKKFPELVFNLEFDIEGDDRGEFTIVNGSVQDSWAQTQE